MVRPFRFSVQCSSQPDVSAASWAALARRCEDLGYSTLTVADHLTFDERIRQEPADHTATAGFSPQRLRQAVIWREILGPPLGLRDSTGRGSEG